jgi:hypothetical protein
VTYNTLWRDGKYEQNFGQKIKGKERVRKNKVLQNEILDVPVFEASTVLK